MTMVLILDGNSEHVAQVLRKTGLFGENKSNALNRSNERDLSINNIWY